MNFKFILAKIIDVHFMQRTIQHALFPGKKSERKLTTHRSIHKYNRN